MALQQLNSHIQSHKYFISGVLIAINILLAIDVVQHRAVQPDCNAQSSATGLASTTDPSSVKVFVAILSRAKNKVVRQAIRDSWGADPRLVRVMFFVLRPDSNHTFRALREEAVQKEDIWVISGTREAYHNTTYSILEIFRAGAIYGDRITHLLKTDEDCYVRVTKLLELLAADPRPWLYGGYPMTDQKDNIQVIRDPKHKWYVPYDNWASDDPVPAYAWGIGAVNSIDLVAHIGAGMPHAISRPDNLMRIEDIAWGIWVDVVLKEQKAKMAKVIFPIDQFKCWNHEVISHLGWLLFVRNDVELSVAHRCMHAHADSCCDKQTLLNMLVDEELRKNKQLQQQQV